MKFKVATQKAKGIKAVVFDGDGVFFTGRVLVDSTGEKLKERSHIDGQGISLLRAHGMKIALISAEATGFLEAIGQKLNNLPSVSNGTWDKIGVFTGPLGKEKISTIDAWLKQHNISWAECAYMGDDLGDLKILSMAGLKAAPAQAEKVIKQQCDFVAERNGGDGAIRDFANFILEAKGVDVTTLDLR